MLASRTVAPFLAVGWMIVLLQGDVSSAHLRTCNDNYAVPISSQELRQQQLLAPPSDRLLGQVVAIRSLELPWAVRLHDAGTSIEVEIRTSGGLTRAAEHRPKIATVFYRLPTDRLEPIISSWREALMKTAPAPYPWISDGTTYHVAAQISGYGMLCGTTVSPGTGLPRKVVEGALFLRQLARLEEDAREQALEVWINQNL